MRTGGSEAAALGGRGARIGGAARDGRQGVPARAMRRPRRWLLAAAWLAGAAPGARAERVAGGLVMPGTPYETPYYVRAGDQPGPSVVVIGGCHGDERAGYMAAARVAGWGVRTGVLWVLPEAHRAAIRRNVRAYPGNMNSMFPGKSDGSSMERLAYGIWQMIKAAKPALLITLHESVGLHAREPARFGQTLTYDFAAETPFVERVLARLNAAIGPPLHRFLPFVAPYEHCPTYNAYRWLGAPAVSVETCRQLELPVRIAYQLAAVEALFDEVGLQYEQADISRLP